MPAYDFKRRFVPAIKAGTKHQTIRRPRIGRSRHARLGEPVQLYTGMRRKGECAIIGITPCRLVEPITLRLRATVRQPCSVTTPSLSRIYAADALDAFARSDGFDDWPDLVRFFEADRRGEETFEGVRIVWEPLGGGLVTNMGRAAA